MKRCYLASENWQEGSVFLGEAESRHLVGVLRARAGERVEVLDGAGRIGMAEILEPNAKRAEVRILSQTTIEPQVPRRILVQALVREQQMDSLIQKAVELGVHEIWPLQTDHAVVKIRPADVGKKTSRWQTIALSSCKQSGNPWLPIIAPVRKLTDALVDLREARGAACFGALQPGALPLPTYFGRLRQENCPQVTMFIGPEGDFSATEVAALLAAGVQPVTFGQRVLRAETAALFILAALEYAWMS